MNYRTALTLIASLTAFSAQAMSIEERAIESRMAVKDFMQSLKHELKTSIKKDGPVAAIKVCNVSAPNIAKQQSVKHGWEIGRTSLKLRNPDNAPDAWEQAVLESFEQRKAKGEDIKQMEFHEVVTEDGQQYFRYMKAIPTAAKPCLVCHGENLKPKIAATLDQLYPNDQARGYKAGDIRGAFTIRQPMNH